MQSVLWSLSTNVLAESNFSADSLKRVRESFYVRAAPELKRTLIDKTHRLRQERECEQKGSMHSLRRAVGAW